MIQRKQSLWLLLAALLNSGVLFFDLYRMHDAATGVDTSFRTGNNFDLLLMRSLLYVTGGNNIHV